MIDINYVAIHAGINEFLARKQWPIRFDADDSGRIVIYVDITDVAKCTAFEFPPIPKEWVVSAETLLSACHHHFEGPFKYFEGKFGEISHVLTLADDGSIEDAPFTTTIENVSDLGECEICIQITFPSLNNFRGHIGDEGHQWLSLKELFTSEEIQEIWDAGKPSSEDSE